MYAKTVLFPKRRAIVISCEVLSKSVVRLYHLDTRRFLITSSKHLVNVDKVVSTGGQAIDVSNRGIALLLVGFLPEVAYLSLLEPTS